MLRLISLPFKYNLYLINVTDVYYEVFNFWFDFSTIKKNGSKLNGYIAEHYIAVFTNVTIVTRIYVHLCCIFLYMFKIKARLNIIYLNRCPRNRSVKHDLVYFAILRESFCVSRFFLFLLHACNDFCTQIIPMLWYAIVYSGI